MSLNEINDYRTTQKSACIVQAETILVWLDDYRQPKGVSQESGRLLPLKSEGEGSKGTFSAIPQDLSLYGSLDTHEHLTVVKECVTNKDILGSEAPKDEPDPGDSLMPNPGDELTDAKIALAEARTDTKLRDVDVKFERVLGEVRLGFQELRTDMASFKGEVGTQLAAMPTRAEARSNMQWTIGTLAALIVAVAGLIVASFQTGLAVGVLPPKSPQLEAAPVVVPAPGAAVPVTPKANPAP